MEHLTNMVNYLQSSNTKKYFFKNIDTLPILSTKCVNFYVFLH